MSSFISRQFSGFVLPGAQTNPTASQTYLWQMTDKPLKYILELADGKVSHDVVTLPASGSFVLPLPNKYVSTNPLFALIVSSETIKCVTVMPAPISATSTTLIRAGLNQDGLASWCGVTTSITLTNPQVVTADIEYLLFEFPDITQASAFRIGEQAVGFQANGADATSGWV